MFLCSPHWFRQFSRSKSNHRMTTCPINTTLPSFQTMAWPLFDSSNILSTSKRRERSGFRAVAEHVPDTSSYCHADENHAIDMAWLCSRNDVVVKLLKSPCTEQGGREVCSSRLSCHKVPPSQLIGQNGFCVQRRKDQQLCVALLP